MSEEKDILILAIESSCDETAAAVVKNGREVLSNVISSQIALHTLYGGVVPEIASRKHIEKINQVIEEALKEAEITLEDIDAIGVTYGPGWLGRFLSVLPKRRQSHMLRRNHWSECIILKDYCSKFYEHKDLDRRFSPCCVRRTYSSGTRKRLRQI